MLGGLTEVTQPVSATAIWVCVQTLSQVEKEKAWVTGSLWTPTSCNPSPPLERPQSHATIFPTIPAVADPSPSLGGGGSRD